MLFGTFQNSGYDKKPVLDDLSVFPSDLFKGDISHGISWCFPITYDYIGSLVNAWISAPSYPVFLLIFRTDDYHRIDKISWYKYVYEHGQDDTAFLNYIDDSLPDSFSEFIVPSTDLSSLVWETLPIALLSKEPSHYLLGDDSFHSALPILNNQLYSLTRKHIPTEEYLDFLQDYNSSSLVHKPDIDNYQLCLNLCFRIYGFYYLPVIFAMILNHDVKLDNLKDAIPIFHEWPSYADKFYSHFNECQNKFSHWADGVFSKSEYLSIYEEFSSLITLDEKVYYFR